MATELTPVADPALSIVICTYNRGHLLAGCIKALGCQLVEANAELIVVDDGSSDDTQGAISRGGVSVVRGGWSENRGLNAARNEGLRLARAPAVLFFDDDQIPPDRYLLNVVRSLEDGFDGVGGPVWGIGDGPRTCATCSSAGDVTLGNERSMSALLLGGNMALKMGVVDQVGMFDERLSGRGDETEWFVRASNHRFLYDPGLWVWHRRDTFTTLHLCRHAYRQGKAIPVYESIVNSRRKPRGRMTLRYLGHAVRYRCSHGLELACREFGAMRGSWDGQRRSRRSG